MKLQKDQGFPIEKQSLPSSRFNSECEIILTLPTAAL